MQPPPPGFPQWGPAPHGPGEHNEPGFSGQPTPPDYGQPPPPAAYSQQPSYGPQTSLGYGPVVPPQTTQAKVGLITFAIVGLLGLLGAILTLTLWINMDSAVNRVADMCDGVSGEYARTCRETVKHRFPTTIPLPLVLCLFAIGAANLAATGGAVMLFLKKHLGQFLILGGGIVMLVLSIGCEARYGATSRLTYDLIAGVIVAAIGGLMFVPAFRVLLGLPPKLTASPQQWPYFPQQPPQYGPPGPPPQQW